MLCAVQESTIGAAFLTKTIPEKGVKFEIWCALAVGLPAPATCMPDQAQMSLTLTCTRPAGTQQGRSDIIAWRPCTTGEGVSTSASGAWNTLAALEPCTARSVCGIREQRVPARSMHSTRPLSTCACIGKISQTCSTS